MSNNEEKSLINSPSQLFVVVILSFILPVAIIISLISFITGDIKIDYSSKDFSNKSVSKRLESVGKVTLVKDLSNAQVSKNLVPVAISKKILSGVEVYNKVCLTCHQNGVAGSPKFGIKQQWNERLKKGTKVLYTNAINGIGIMPAKGGAVNLSDDEIQEAVDYIIQNLE